MNSELKILVDSCVWIDSYLGDHPQHDESLLFLREAYESGAQLLYGASKLESIFYVLIAEVKRMVRHEKGQVGESDALAARAFAWGCLQNMQDIATAVGMDESDIWLAGKYKSLCPDFEDNVLLAAAQRCGADYVVTWDIELLHTPIAKTADPTKMRAVLKLMHS